MVSLESDEDEDDFQSLYDGFDESYARSSSHESEDDSDVDDVTPPLRAADVAQRALSDATDEIGRALNEVADEDANDDDADDANERRAHARRGLSRGAVRRHSRRFERRHERERRVGGGPAALN
jgi:hypothetical protein